MAGGLATRCPSCATLFRVVPDQLRVSDGWVRCGRCAEVFNAAAALVDLETGQPRALPEEPPPGAEAPGAEQWEPTAVPSHPPADEAADEGEALPVVDDSASRFGAEALEPEAPMDSEARADPAELPSFMRRAQRGQRWHRPGVRAALVGVALLAVLGLAAQLAYAYRELVAARFPMARPALERTCQALGCRVGAALVIDALVVESSGLVRVERSNVYRLSAVLRNRAAIAVAAPALELALTDTQGKLLARRVLRAAELGAPQPTLGAGRETALQATLQMNTPPVAGYTIELFYP